MNTFKSCFYSLTYGDGFINITDKHGNPLCTELYCEIETDIGIFSSVGKKNYQILYDTNVSQTTITELYNFPSLTMKRITELPHEQNHIVFYVSINTKTALKVKKISVLKMACGVLSAGDIEDCRIFTAPQYKLQCMVRNGFDDFTTDKLYGGLLPYREGEKKGMLDADCFGVYRDYGSLISYRQDMGECPGWGQGCYEGFIYNKALKRIFVFGFITFNRYLCKIDLAANNGVFNKFTLFNPIENEKLNAGNNLESESVYFSVSDNNPFNARAEYALAAQKQNNCDEFFRPVSGWCSWHRTFQHMDEETILKVIDYIHSHPEIFSNIDGGFEYIQIDYCWQKYCGRIDVDERKFPNGMRFISDEIRKRGFKPGIWISPTLVDVGKEENDFDYSILIKDKNNNPKIHTKNWFGRQNITYCLDVTNPKALEFALKQIETIIVDWNFDMIKMDFLEGSMVKWDEDPDNTIYFNKTTSSVEHLKLFLIAIKDHVNLLEKKLGKKIFLSPCGSPLYHLAGIFPLNYICEDAGYQRLDETMGPMAFALTWATRLNINGRVFTSNLESVLLDEPRTANEAKLLLTCAAMSGGVVFIGDLPHNMPYERLKWYSKILPLHTEQAIPLDYFDSQIPSIYSLSVDTEYEKYKIIALINWNKSEKEFKIPLPIINLYNDTQYHAFSFWDNKYYGIIENSLQIALPPIDCALLCIKEKSNIPQIIGTNSHFMQGYYEINDLEFKDETLSFSYTFLRTGEHCIYLYIPDECKLKNAVAIDADIQVLDIPDKNIYSINLNSNLLKKSNIKILFEWSN